MTEPDAPPWPLDPTPGDMAYVGVCPACHGITMVCPVEVLNTNFSMLRKNILSGAALHRLPVQMVKNPSWHFCHCYPHNEETLPWPKTP